jgi:hypothetical protein
MHCDNIHININLFFCLMPTCFGHPHYHLGIHCNIKSTIKTIHVVIISNSDLVRYRKILRLLIQDKIDKIGLKSCHTLYWIKRLTILRYLTRSEFGCNYNMCVLNCTLDIAMYALIMVNVDDQNM